MKISRTDLDALAATHRLVPITRSLFAVAETPVGVYRKLAGGRPGAELYSVTGVTATQNQPASSNTAIFNVIDWNAVGEFMPAFWHGLLVTLQALALGSLVSFTLGLVWTLLMRSPARWVRWPVGVVTEFVRNTPLLVQLFFFF